MSIRQIRLTSPIDQIRREYARQLPVQIGFAALSGKVFSDNALQDAAHDATCKVVADRLQLAVDTVTTAIEVFGF